MLQWLSETNSMKNFRQRLSDDGSDDSAVQYGQLMTKDDFLQMMDANGIFISPQ
jgi:hypothetical protein